MAKVKVNAGAEEFFSDYNKLAVVKQSDSEWIYRDNKSKAEIVIDGDHFNKDGKFITTGDVSSVHFLDGKHHHLLDASYGHHPLDASQFASTGGNVWGVIYLALQGNDRITGGNGNDYIIGGDGVDHINAGAGSNTVAGSAGNDKIDVGKGNDFIVLDAYTDSDTVKHFDADGSDGLQDIIFAKYSDCTVVADGDNTKIEFQDGGDELILVGINHHDIDASDFLM